MRVLGARYYSPEIGRFVQPDSMLPDMYDPQQLNRYAYVRGNPLKYVDPTGHAIETMTTSELIIGALNLRMAKGALNAVGSAALAYKAASLGAKSKNMYVGAGAMIIRAIAIGSFSNAVADTLTGFKYRVSDLSNPEIRQQAKDYLRDGSYNLTSSVINGATKSGELGKYASSLGDSFFTLAEKGNDVIVGASKHGDIFVVEVDLSKGFSKGELISAALDYSFEYSLNEIEYYIFEQPEVVSVDQKDGVMTKGVHNEKTKSCYEVKQCKK